MTLVTLRQQRLANKVDVAMRFANEAKRQTEAENAKVKDLDPRSLTVGGLATRATGAKRITEAASSIDAANQLRTQGLLESALREFEAAGEKYISARQQLEQVEKKAKGMITKVEVTTNIGDDDMEKNGFLVIYVGGQEFPLGVNEHWNSHKPGPKGSTAGLQIDIEKTIDIKAGLQNHKNQRNIVVDADFSVTLHMTDVTGKTSKIVIPVQMQRYSTDGGGLGASNIRVVRSVHRNDFE